jgi:TrmH family RNA methyltransferase
LFVAEGIRAVDELLRSPITIRGVLVALGGADERSRILAATVQERGIPVQAVTDAEFVSAADTETPQGILAIADVPRRNLAELPIHGRSRLVVLDAVQDPGNVGTIVRTAAALGATATLTLPGTVDLWNAKVVRSSMGALFHHPAIACTWEELTSFLSDGQFPLWGADPAGEPLHAVVRGPSDVPERLAMVVGNEGAGLSSRAREGADKLVAIDIASTVESLNVAVATGIMLYELR